MEKGQTFFIWIMYWKFGILYLYVLRLVESKNCDVSKNVADLRADHNQHQHHADAHVQHKLTKINFLRCGNYLLIIRSTEDIIFCAM